MTKLDLWADYTREDVHAIFSPQTTFTPQAGTWGLQGIVRIPDSDSDWVFFVTFGQKQGEHTFDESITEDGVLSWQSQPLQKLSNKIIKKLIGHDDLINTIHLFLRTSKKDPYTYLGTLGYLTHDDEREPPVYFQWQLLDWPAPNEVIKRIGVSQRHVALNSSTNKLIAQTNFLEIVPAPREKPTRRGVPTQDFKTRKIPNYAEQDHKNRKLGLSGESLVLAQEIATLKAAGCDGLSQQVVHVSVAEGDGAGYDIRSFSPDGRPRYIEVKTTKGGANTPFFISPKEIAFSENKSDTYSLIRVFEFDAEKNYGKAFVLNGNLKKSLELTPTEFRAVLNQC